MNMFRYLFSVLFFIIGLSNESTFFSLLFFSFSLYLLFKGIKVSKIKKMKLPKEPKPFLSESAKYVKVGTTAEQIPYSQDTFVAIDLETTGLKPSDNQIIEIGAVRFVDGKPFDEFQTFADPIVSIPKRITELTGITDKDVKYSPRPSQAISYLSNFVGSSPIVFHNAPFDLGFLGKDFSANREVIDTLSLSRQIHPEYSSHKLKDLKKLIGIESNNHRALDDAKATGFYYLSIRDEVKKHKVSTAFYNENFEFIEEQDAKIFKAKSKADDAFKAKKIDKAIEHMKTAEALSSELKRFAENELGGAHYFLKHYTPRHDDIINTLSYWTENHDQIKDKWDKKKEK